VAPEEFELDVDSLHIRYVAEGEQVSEAILESIRDHSFAQGLGQSGYGAVSALHHVIFLLIHDKIPSAVGRLRCGVDGWCGSSAVGLAGCAIGSGDWRLLHHGCGGLCLRG
jgi:hypothetical protein